MSVGCVLLPPQRNEQSSTRLVDLLKKWMKSQSPLPALVTPPLPLVSPPTVSSSSEVNTAPLAFSVPCTVMEVSNFGNHRRPALPKGLKPRKDLRIARLWSERRDSRRLADDVERADAPQGLGVRNIMEVGWKDCPAESIKRECEAFEG